MTKQNTAKAAPGVTDLRQRAARARDAAGRFIKRPASAETSSGEADPVYAVIERHLAARAASVGLDDGLDKEGYEAAHDRRFEALEAVEAIRPTTVAGLFALARHMDDYLNEDAGGENIVEATCSGYAFVALINSCLALQEAIEAGALGSKVLPFEAAPDMGITMSTAAGPETGLPVTGSQIGGRLPAPEHDLSALSIVELARLYTVVVRVEEVMGSAENAPCFWSADKSRTGAGRIINWEADRLQGLAADVAREIHRRQPADDDEAEERANTLLFHTVVTGGVAEHPELIAEINATWGA